ncbi:MAG: phenylacetate-CoA oxygenase subunit PaaJ [Edaphocola sp.]
MAATDEIWDILATISDPEIPVISILDLGIVRKVAVEGNEQVTVTITPTYNGCPAMNMIATEIRMALAAAGHKNVEIKNQLSPAWNTDWLSKEGRQKLHQYGIAPPVGASGRMQSLFGAEPKVACPHCGGTHTTMVSYFGSTACKAHYRCIDCKEPFDYFKCH